MCTVAIDYDGTITADFDKAREAITELRRRGHYVVIWSSRNNPVQHGDQQEAVFKDMVDTLQRHQVPYDQVDTGYCGKFHAQVYIDDKAWRFEHNWDEIVSRIY